MKKREMKQSVKLWCTAEALGTAMVSMELTSVHIAYLGLHLYNELDWLVNSEAFSTSCS